MAVVDLATQSGKPARTDIALLDSVDPVCFVRCTLHTGRTHQIRVHMASLRHPLVGDALYGGEAAGARAAGAARVPAGFRPSHDGEPMEFHAPLPPDMENALDFGACATIAPSGCTSRLARMDTLQGWEQHQGLCARSR